MMLIICDVNTLISVTMEKGQTVKALRKTWELGLTKLCLCQEMLDEFTDVMQRPRLQRFVGHVDLNQQIKRFLSYGELVFIHKPYPESPDPKDNYLLAMLRDSAASHLITGDKKLLELGQYQDKPILTMAEFLLNQGWL